MQEKRKRLIKGSIVLFQTQFAHIYPKEINKKIECWRKVIWIRKTPGSALVNVLYTYYKL